MKRKGDLFKLAAVVFVCVAWFLGNPIPASAQVCDASLTTIQSDNVDPQKSTEQPNIFGGDMAAQTFTLPAGYCWQFSAVTLSLCAIGSPGPLTVEIRNVAEQGFPGETVLASGSVQPTNQCSDYYGDQVVNLSPSVSVPGGTKLAVVIYQANGAGNGASSYQLGISKPGPQGTDLYFDGQYFRKNSSSSPWQHPDGLSVSDARVAICLSSCGVPPSPPQEGPTFCTLTQGAYGAPRSGSATSLGNQDCSNPQNMGILVQAACAGDNVFSGDQNPTTIGVYNGRSVTIGGSGVKDPFDSSFLSALNALITYLPATGTPAPFATSGPNAPGPTTHYLTGGSIPCTNPKQGNSCGNGAGTLAGQTMTNSLNAYFSSKGWFPSGLDDFQVSNLVCTKSGNVCQAVQYPSCVAGQKVSDIRSAANTHLATGSNGLLCTASELTQALDNINSQFDGCAQVVDCPTSVGTAGPFDCSLL